MEQVVRAWQAQESIVFQQNQNHILAFFVEMITEHDHYSINMLFFFNTS